MPEENETETPQPTPQDEPLKWMSLTEFQEKGFLQEVNRRVLHPAGLALALSRNPATNQVVFVGVLDARNDPEGYYFDPAPDAIKESHVEGQMLLHADARIELFGNPIQPTEDPIDEEDND